MSSHLSMENIELCVTGKLDNSKTPQVYAHIKVCETCRKEYEECQKNIDAANEIRQALKISTICETAHEEEELSSEIEEFDGYQLIKEIHRGGQGVVYEAFHKATNRRVALKVLLGGPFAGKNAKRRFEREVNLAANLHHPNIVTIHDSGIARDHYYLVMDYIDGQPLDKYISEKPLSFDQKINLFCKICDAINFAHQRGVIHRDLKPSNILVTQEGDPCVLDFGLARRMENDYETETLSKDGQILGTPKYMAPEQTNGKLSGIDVRTDIYALGLIFYKILTGDFPYHLDDNIRQILCTIQETPPIKPSLREPHLDKDIEAIVLKTLEKNPEHRYQSVAELQQDINLWKQGLPIVARSASSIYVLNRLISRNRFTTIVVGLLFAIILGYLMIYINLYHTTEAARVRSDLSRKKLVEALSDRFAYVRTVRFLLFINAWENGLTMDAHNFAFTIKDSTEGDGAEFLLNPYPLAEKEAVLRNKLGHSQEAFTEFILAELDRKECRWNTALNHYKKSLLLISGTSEDRWLKYWINGRIMDVEVHLSGREVAKR